MKCERERCKGEATDSGRCDFHNVDWQAHYAAADAERDEYAEATGGRNLFMDRLAGRQG